MRKYENVKIDKLIPYANNARTHDEEQIEKISRSIKEFGFINPVLIDSDYMIIAGHGRVMAAEKLGMKELPCLFIEDLTDEQKRAYIIADNKLALDAGWDEELLKLELEELNNLNFDISLTGFDFGDLFIEEEQEPAVEDEFNSIIDNDIEPKAKLGDIYQLGSHRLMCGDSTKFEDVKKLMNNELADLVITDPPYNVDYEGTAGKIENDNMASDEFREFLSKAFSNMAENMKSGASYYVWYASKEHINFESALLDNDLKVRQQLIWNKSSLVLSRQDYHWKHEPCLYGWKDGASHNWYGDRSQTTVLDFEKPNKSDLHPTMKPVLLFDYQIKNSTKQNDKVLDLFGGSGTTIMACEQNNRNAYVMEYDPVYVDAIIERWEQFTGEKAILVN